MKACEVNIGVHSETDEYITIYEKPMSRSFIDLCPRSKVTQIQHFQTSFPKKKKKNTRPFEDKFHMEPPWDVGM